MTRPSKYGAKRTEFRGRSFASGLEARLFGQLKLLEAAGEVREVRQQVSVWLTEARIEYKADFSAFDVKRGETYWLESKGFRTPEFNLKLRLYRHYGPGRLEIWEDGGRGRLRLKETVIPRSSNA